MAELQLNNRETSKIYQSTISEKDGATSSSQDIVTAAKGSGAIFAGQLFEYASRFIFGLILARSVGTEGYGLYNLGDTVVGTLAIFSLLGLPAGVVRFLPAALGKDDEENVWGILQVAIALVGITSLLLAAGVFGLSNWIAGDLFHEPAAAPTLRIASLWIPLLTMSNLLASAVRGFKQMRYQVYANSIVFNLSRLALTVLALSFGLGVLGVFAANVVASAVTVALLLYYLNRLFSLKRPLRAARYNTRELLFFSMPLFFTHAIRQLRNQMELLILGMLGTVAAVGVYSVALRVQVFGTALVFAVQTAVGPIIADLHHQGNYAQLRRLYRTLTKWVFSFNLPFFLTTVLFAEPILAIFGRDFTVGTTILVIGALGTLVAAATGICSVMIQMMGYSRLSFYNSLIALVLRLVLDVLFIRMWGAVGAAVATALFTLIMSVVTLFEVRWVLGAWPYDLTFLKSVVASLVALAVGLAVNHLLPADRNLFYLMFDAGLLWCSYTAVTLLLRLSEEDQMLLGRVRRQFSARFHQL